jgi:N6-L-threonylcarbamoyladenine synthase
MSDFGHYKKLGATVDDAAGEAFDKVARMLGFPYPGGPKISQLAQKNRLEKPVPELILPRPMLHSQNLNFSFSGLKTAVLYKLKAEGRTDDSFKEDVARAFEDAVVDVLVQKTRTALLEHPEGYRTLIVGGGVAANAELQRSLHALAQEFPGLILYIPSKLLATDNAIMIGLAAYVKAMTAPQLLSQTLPLKAEGNLSF